MLQNMTLGLIFLQLSIATAALFTTTPYLVQGIVVPNAGSTVEIPRITDAIPLATTNLLLKRAEDDEWQIVIYNNGKLGDQCGGVANTFTGKGSLCQGLVGTVGKLCAGAKVGVNLPFVTCEFKFKEAGEDCGGDEVEKISLKPGERTDGVNLSDEVKFVQITYS